MNNNIINLGNQTEMMRLGLGLTERGITYTLRAIRDGLQILCEDWDAICTNDSYGGFMGLLEVYGAITLSHDKHAMEGLLSAADVLARVDNLRKED